MLTLSKPITYRMQNNSTIATFDNQSLTAANLHTLTGFADAIKDG